jgi:hypothetical protein
MTHRTRTHLPLLAFATGCAVTIGFATQACYRVDNPDYVEVFEAEGTNLVLHLKTPEGEPLAFAHVTVAGETALTDSAGFVSFDGLPAGRMLARVDAEGYASAVIAAEVGDDTSVYEDMQLLPLGEAQSFEVSEGASLDDLQSGTVHVEIAPNSLVDAAGNLVTGTAEATIVPIDPTTEEGRAQLPGPLHAKRTSDNVLLRSIAMAEISVWQNGERLRLAPGATARISIDLPASVTDQVEEGDEFSAWWLDLESGLWHEDGVGIVEDIGGQLVWVAQVSHFTWWNCDVAIEWANTQCMVINVDVEGDVQAGAEPIPLANVGVILSDDALGSYKDKGTTLLSEENHGSNCMVFEGGTVPDLTVRDYTVSLEDLPNYSAMGVGEGGCYANPEDEDYVENTTNASCTSLRMLLPKDQGFEKVCEPGTSRSCPGSYTGPRGTEGVGICHGDLQYCVEGGLAWSECSGEVTPQEETCTTVNIDDDCDGATDDYTDGERCECSQAGVESECYFGPTGTQGVGACAAGTRICEYVGGTLVFGECLSEITPTAEDCTTTDSLLPAHDENCDGVPTCSGEYLGTVPTNLTVNDIAVGPDGSVYLVGLAYGDLEWKGTVLKSADDTSADVAVVELDPNGEVQWAELYGGDGFDSGLAIAVTAAGDIMITGTFTNSIALDELETNPSPSTGTRAMFVARIDSKRNIPWGEVYHGTSASSGVVGHSEGHDIAIDPAKGHVFVTGTVHGEDPFGQQETGVGEGGDLFVASFEYGGAPRFLETYVGGGKERGEGIVVGPSGDLFVTGFFDQSIEFGGGTLPTTSTGSFDIFVARLDPGTGLGRWLDPASFGSVKEDTARAIAVDSSGNLFVTGTFRDSIEFDTKYTVAMGSGVDYAYVLGLEPTMGTPIGSQAWPENSGGDDAGTAIAVDGRDYVIFTGYFNGAGFHFGGPPEQQFDSQGGKGIMVVKFENSLNHVWAQYPGNGSVQALATSPSGRIFVGGDITFATLEP